MPPYRDCAYIFLRVPPASLGSREKGSMAGITLELLQKSNLLYLGISSLSISSHFYERAPSGSSESMADIGKIRGMKEVW